MISNRVRAGLISLRGGGLHLRRLTVLAVWVITFQGSLGDTAFSQESTEEKLTELIELTETIREQVNRPLDSSSDGNGPSSSAIPLTPRTESSSAPTTIGPSIAREHVDGIQSQLQLLRRLRRERQRQTVVPPTASPESAIAIPDVADSPPSPSVSDAQTQLKEMVNQIPPPEQEPKAEEEVGLDATRVVPSTVDHFRLGETLYQTGNYEAALKAFQAIEPETLTPSDRSWLDLFVGVCSRKIGDSEKSYALLRDVANVKSRDYPVLAAQKWLKHVETIDNYVQRMEGIDSTIAEMNSEE